MKLGNHLSERACAHPCGVRAVAVTLALSLTLAGQTQPAPRVRIVVIEGEGAINNIAARTARDPVIQVMDDDSRPIRGATVTFTLPEFGASGAFSERGTTLTVMTDEEGRAAGRGLRPNNVAGEFQIRVTASHDGEMASADITQTNVAPAVRSGSNRKLILAGLLAGGAVAGIAFGLRGGGDSSPSSPGAQPGTGTGIVLTPGSPVFGPPR